MKITKSFLAIAILSVLFLFGCTQGPEKVAKKFLDAEQKKDFKTMKELSTDDSQQMISLLESVMAKDTTKTKDAAPLNVTKTELKDTTAICTYCCSPDGKDNTLHMRKTDKGWKVDMSKETLMGGKDVKDMIKSSMDSTGVMPVDPVSGDSSETESADSI